MNERIRELAEQAGFPEWANHAIEFELEQFAESLINECADIATINQFQHDPVGRFVREHFGVTGF
jgi:hypothetical protein